MSEAQPSAEPPRLLCICGAPAPVDLPEPGTPPVRCRACDTPLVSPGRVAGWRVQRAFAAAAAVGIVCALLWMLASQATGSGAPLVVALAGGVVGAAARACSRSRGTIIQAAALVGFVLFVLFGEVLLFQRALHPRLVAMHEREGAEDPELRATHELERVRDYPFDRKLEHFLHIEATLGLFLALAAGGGLALIVTRAPPAVAAFDRRARVLQSPPQIEPATADAGWEVVEHETTEAGGDEPPPPPALDELPADLPRSDPEGFDDDHPA